MSWWLPGALILFIAAAGVLGALGLILPWLLRIRPKFPTPRPASLSWRCGMASKEAADILGLARAIEMLGLALNSQRGVQAGSRHSGEVWHAGRQKGVLAL